MIMPVSPRSTGKMAPRTACPLRDICRRHDDLSMDPRPLSTPLDAATVRSLHVGDMVQLNGRLISARDAAHRRLIECLDQNLPLPVALAGQALYYVGPTPAPPGRAIGSAGPTTSGRMDPYTPRLLAATGLRALIGKGPRSAAVVEALQAHDCVYLAATGGAAALLAERISAAEVIAYPDLGPEAIHLFQVEDFPAVVAIDCHGGNLYQRG